MPNISPRGLFARAGAAAVAPATSVYATLPGSTDPADVLEVWCGAADGTPVLVYASQPGVPPTATAAYSSATGVVTIEWDADVAADGFVVKRADGSTVGTVAGSVGTLVDTAPRALTGEYTITGTLVGMVGTPKATNSLDLREAPVVVAAVLESSVVLGWAHPLIGQPPSGYRIERNGSTVATVLRSSTTWTDTNPPVGTVATYTVTPLWANSTTAASDSDTEAVPAAPPTGVTLAAVGSLNLRLAWAHPGGSRTGYEVERYVSSWAAHATPASSATSSDWATSVPGSMRVRTLSAGGPSWWVEVGPVTPLAGSPPSTATVTSWKPEASYGRMVVRATMPADANVTAWRPLVANGAGTYTDYTGWLSATPGAAVNAAPVTFPAGTVANVKVEVRNSVGLTSTTGVTSYTLAASPIEIMATDSGTHQSPLAWRNDSQRNATELATGSELGVRDNGAIFLYGTTIAAALAGKTVTEMTIEYVRENELGLTSAVTPLFWLHDRTTKTGTPQYYDGGVSEANRVGAGVARTGTTAARWSLPAAWIPILQAGTWKGLAMWSLDRTGNANMGTYDKFFMHLFAAGSTALGSPPMKPGRLLATHLG